MVPVSPWGRAHGGTGNFLNPMVDSRDTSFYAEDMSNANPTVIEAPDHMFGYSEERNESNTRRALENGLEPCTHCGRGVAEGKGWVVVVVNGGGDIALPDGPEFNDTNDAGFMGAWVLGPTCAKGIPAAYRTRWNGWTTPEAVSA